MHRWVENATETDIIANTIIKCRQRHSFLLNTWIDMFWSFDPMIFILPPKNPSTPPPQHLLLQSILVLLTFMDTAIKWTVSKSGRKLLLSWTLTTKNKLLVSENKSSKGPVRDANAGPPNCESDARTTRSCCFLLLEIAHFHCHFLYPKAEFNRA